MSFSIFFESEFLSFVSACRIVNVHLFNESGNSSNECFVDLESENDVKDAMKKRNLSMGNRHVESNLD